MLDGIFVTLKRWIGRIDLIQTNLVMIEAENKYLSRNSINSDTFFNKSRVKSTYKCCSMRSAMHYIYSHEKNWWKIQQHHGAHIGEWYFCSFNIVCCVFVVLAFVHDSVTQILCRCDIGSVFWHICGPVDWLLFTGWVDLTRNACRNDSLVLFVSLSRLQKKPLGLVLLRIDYAHTYTYTRTYLTPICRNFRCPITFPRQAHPDETYGGMWRLCVFVCRVTTMTNWQVLRIP